jgi:DNA-binding response OmpR family regulator
VTKPICPSNLLARTRNLLTRLNTSFAHRTFSSRSTWAFNSECGRWILVCNREREADKVVRVDCMVVTLEERVEDEARCLRRRGWFSSICGRNV